MVINVSKNENKGAVPQHTFSITDTNHWQGKIPPKSQDPSTQSQVGNATRYELSISF